MNISFPPFLGAQTPARPLPPLQEVVRAHNARGAARTSAHPGGVTPLPAGAVERGEFAEGLAGELRGVAHSQTMRLSSYLRKGEGGIMTILSPFANCPLTQLAPCREESGVFGAAILNPPFRREHFHESAVLGLALFLMFSALDHL